MIGVVRAVDDRVAADLALIPSNYGVVSNFVIEAIGRRRRSVGENPFTIVPSPVENDGVNVVITVSLEKNEGGQPYRVTLSAVQGRSVWARTVERGAGRERPGFERLLAGEEGGLMPLNQRLAASLPVDLQDLGNEFVQRTTWEIGGD